MFKKDKSKEIIQENGIDMVVGIDVANSTIKVYTDGDKYVSYRNTVKEINDAGLVYSFKTDYHMYVFENQVYEVGDISAMSRAARGAARYGSNSFRVEAVIGITSILKEGIRPRIRVVTGVPSYLAKNKKIMDEVKKSLLGSFEVKSVLWDKVEDIAFDVVDVIVVPQPLGTMYTYLCDKDGHLDQKLLNQKALVIDIGFGTTDIAMLESGRVRSTFGFDAGTSDYLSAIQEEVNNDIPQANIQSLNAHELDEQLLKSNMVETPFGTFDLSPYVEKNKQDQAERIYQEVMSLGLEFNKFYKIILTGGGSLLYQKYLLEKFDDPRVIIQKDAILANAHGFYLLGRQS